MTSKPARPWKRMSKARARLVLMARQPLPHPCNVYKEDAMLTLHRHTPPSSTLANLTAMPLLDDNSLLLERSVNGRLCNCARHTVIPSSTSAPLQIKLLQPLSVGLRVLRLAQVWKVELGGKICVARIYDPLYVRLELGMEDIFPSIERLVIAETTAYKRLGDDLQGNLIPKFIDCFLTMVDTTDDDIFRPIDPAVEIPNQRSVWVLLAEFIPGTDLEQKQPSLEHPVCNPHKLAVIRAAFVAWHSMARRGILHDDFADRNLILKSVTPSRDPFCTDCTCNLRFQIATTLLEEYSPAASFPIAVIDFENSDVTEISEYDTRVGEWERAQVKFAKLDRAWFCTA